MKKNEMRKYNCKDEELVPICGYVVFSMKRDLNDFKVFSSKMNGAYLSEFEGRINAVSEVLNPKNETAELKAITTRLYETMDSLTEPIDQVKGYIRLAKESVPISATDFGLTFLRRKLKVRDSEGVLQSIKIVHANLLKYKTQLSQQGLTDELIRKFEQALVSIAEDNQKQYEIISKRKAIVQSNKTLFNELYSQLIEICEIGKVLYKGKDALKLQEYTFSELKKSVRVAAKPKKEEEE